MMARRSPTREWTSIVCASLVLAVLATTAQPAPAQEEIDAASVYEQQCAICHGADARGGIGPTLVDSPLPLEEQVALTAAGKDSMPAYGDLLTPEQIDAVLRYAQVLGGAESQGEEGTAAEIFAESCAGCHGEDASGGEGGPSLRDTTAELSLLVPVISDGRGTMPAFGETYTTSEIDALAVFVIGLRTSRALPPEPVAAGAILYAESCAGCHGADASGGSAMSLLQTGLETDALRSAIAQGQGRMPAFDSLGSGNVDALVAYLQAVVASSAVSTTTSSTTTSTTTTEPASQDTVPTTTTTVVTTTTVAAAPPLVEPLIAGELVYSGNCALCHGTLGEGGAGPRLQGTSLTANEIIARVYGGHTEGMPAFEQALQAAEVQEVALYVLTLPERTSEEGGSSQNVVIGGLVAVLALAGGLLAVRRWRARRAGRSAD